MKQIIKFLLLAIIVLGISCTKQESTAYYTGGTAPVLTGTSNTGGASISLKASDSTLPALNLAWTNPNYMYNYGVSSIDVTYLIEIDTVGSNFTNPKRAQIPVPKELSSVLTESVVNASLTSVMGLDTSFAHNLQVRVVATQKTSGTGVNAIVSNILSFTAKPFYPPPVVTPPSTGTLYLVGGSGIMGGGGWSNTNPFQAGYQFTKVSNTLYTLTVTLMGGDNTTDKNQFLFLPLAGDWGHKYACTKTANQLTSGGSFGYDFSDNFPGPGAGTYKITVNFQSGTYTVVQQ